MYVKLQSAARKTRGFERSPRAAVDRRRPTRAGPPPGHRTGLGRDTGMRVYDAELLRLRAHTYTGPGARQAGLAAALKLSVRASLIPSFDHQSVADHHRDVAVPHREVAARQHVRKTVV